MRIRDVAAGIETQLLESGQGLRSKTQELVRQEFWALLLAHYAIRALMTEAADTADIDPDRLSFIRTLNIVRRQVANQAGFPPDILNRARTDAITEILERVTTGRRKRTYPRVHKRGNRHNYSIKKPDHRQRPYNPKPVICTPEVA